jgi:hypothetical protein
MYHGDVPVLTLLMAIKLTNTVRRDGGKFPIFSYL